VLLIEHDIGLVSQVSQHIAVLSFGRLIAEGSPDTVRTDATVIEAYLGSPEDDSPRRRQPRGGIDAS
jgi:branched-chain amino acid transport system ATP-binding protein